MLAIAATLRYLHLDVLAASCGGGNHHGVALGVVHWRGAAIPPTRTPRALTRFTASSSGSRLNVRLVPICRLRLHHHARTRCQ